jgi:sorbitol/mannitol transport system permease protein
MMAPAVFLLLVWMLVPADMTLWFSFATICRCAAATWVGRVRKLRPASSRPALLAQRSDHADHRRRCPGHHRHLGVLLAMLLDQPMWGQGIVRILVIAPFFVMPTVSALVWKNMFMDPTNGVFAHLWRFFGAEPVVWLSDAPLQSIVLIVSWQWLPFATLILLTAIQSLDSEQLEAAEMDGASPLARFFFIAAAPEPRHHHRDPDPDDLPAVDLRRDLRHHRRRLRHPDAHLPDLPARAGKPERRSGLARAASTPSSLPTSSRSS